MLGPPIDLRARSSPSTKTASISRHRDEGKPARSPSRPSHTWGPRKCMCVASEKGRRRSVLSKGIRVPRKVADYRPPGLEERARRFVKGEMRRETHLIIARFRHLAPALLSFSLSLSVRSLTHPLHALPSLSIRPLCASPSADVRWWSMVCVRVIRAGVISHCVRCVGAAFRV